MEIWGVLGESNRVLCEREVKDLEGDDSRYIIYTL